MANYRKFKDTKELINYWSTNYDIRPRPKFSNPNIWIKCKCDCNSDKLISEYGVDWIKIEFKQLSMQILFEKYTFLDGSPCGVPVKEDDLKNTYNNEVLI